MSRRVWFAQDCLFTADPKIAELGTEFGPAGPMAITHLLGAAKLQDEGGRVTISYKNLSRGAFLRSGAHARNIVARATELGVLEMIAIDKVGFEGRFPKWMRWQVTDPNAATRKARQRAGQRRDIDRDIPVPVPHLQPPQETETTTTTALTPKEALSATLDTLQAAEWPGGVDAIKVKQAMAAYPELSAPAAALIAVTWRQRPGFKTEHAHIAFLAALRNEQQRRDKGAKDDRPAKVYDLKTVCRDCGRRLAQAERSTGRCDPCFERYAEKVLDDNGDAA